MQRLKIVIIAVVAVLMPQIAAGQNQIKRPGKKKTTEQTTKRNPTKAMPAKQRNNGAGSSSNDDLSMSDSERDAVIEKLINNMVYVEGGSFMMGSEDSEAYEEERPAHRKNVGSFQIGKYEVTQKEWRAVMGSNPSFFKGDNMPVERVTWDECQEFIEKLNTLTGKDFRLPTEPEWEYAARGGKLSKEYKYSGSNNIDKVACYESNNKGGTNQVGTKEPNELGLYDMSGNVWEWTATKWRDNYSKTNYTSLFAYRGGGWDNEAHYCRIPARYRGGSNERSSRLGFRLATWAANAIPSEQTNTGINTSLNKDSSMSASERDAVLQNLINNMVYVEGGSFMIGSDDSEAKNSEKPVNQQIVKSFHIGRYEVTQKEWKAVMGSNPSKFKGDDLPVGYITWDQCQEFISKLNSLTGKTFRLPTEQEWEYASRGGNHSLGYRYSGSNDINSVAWYEDNSGGKPHKVGTKEANELGLYDMSGNAKEWTSSHYNEDYSKPRNSPKLVVRGGSCFLDNSHCRVSNRDCGISNWIDIDHGLRLAL